MMKQKIVPCSTCSSKNKSVFCELSNDHLNQLDASKKTITYERHEIVFSEGDQPQGLYCISAGKIKMYKMDVSGHQKIVRIAIPGDIIGYRCLLANEPYSVTAASIEHVSICFLNKQTFLHVLETHPQTALNVMKALSQDVGQLEGSTLTLVHKNIRERLAELFLIFKNRFGQKTEKGYLLNIQLTREELAEAIGSTQESVIRLISDFKDEGLIQVKGRHITISNMEKMMNVANVVD